MPSPDSNLWPTLLYYELHIHVGHIFICYTRHSFISSTQDFIQAVKAKRNAKPEIRIQKPEPGKSFISIAIYWQQRKLSSKNVILIHAYDNNCLYWMENTFFSNLIRSTLEGSMWQIHEDLPVWAEMFFDLPLDVAFKIPGQKRDTSSRKKIVKEK